MTPDEIKAYIKQYLAEHLSVESHTERGSYGSGDHVKVQLYLEGEEISSTYVDIPKD